MPTWLTWQNLRAQIITWFPKSKTAILCIDKAQHLHLIVVDGHLDTTLQHDALVKRYSDIITRSATPVNLSRKLEVYNNTNVRWAFADIDEFKPNERARETVYSLGHWDKPDTTQLAEADLSETCFALLLERARSYSYNRYSTGQKNRQKA
jgi:hypothetical protein